MHKFHAGVAPELQPLKRILPVCIKTGRHKDDVWPEAVGSRGYNGVEHAQHAPLPRVPCDRQWWWEGELLVRAMMESNTLSMHRFPAYPAAGQGGGRESYWAGL